jgi:hypothetical protein
MTRIPDRDRSPYAMELPFNTIMCTPVFFPFPLLQGFAGMPNSQTMDSYSITQDSSSLLFENAEIDSQGMVSTMSISPVSHHDFMPHQGQFELQTDQETVLATALKPRIKSNPVLSPKKTTTVQGVTKKPTATPSKRRNSCKYKECVNCKTTETPMWRKGPNGTLCNKCGLYHLRHSKSRPLTQTKSKESTAAPIALPAPIEEEILEPIIDDISSDSRSSVGPEEELEQPQSFSSTQEVMNLFMINAFGTNVSAMGLVESEPFPDNIFYSYAEKSNGESYRSDTPDFFVSLSDDEHL